MWQKLMTLEFIRGHRTKLVAVVLSFLLWYVVKDQVARGKMSLPEGWPQMRTAKV